MHKNCNQTNKHSKSEKSERNLTWELSHPEKVSTLFAHKQTLEKIIPWPPQQKNASSIVLQPRLFVYNRFQSCKVAVTRLAGSSETWNDPQNEAKFCKQEK
jgi:hypothetical protein